MLANFNQIRIWKVYHIYQPRHDIRTTLKRRRNNVVLTSCTDYKKIKSKKIYIIAIFDRQLPIIGDLLNWNLTFMTFPNGSKCV